MIDRLQKNNIIQLLRSYPAVAIVGPRQAGKTTLARALSNSYYDLELPQDRVRVDLEWSQITEIQDSVVVLDEAQSYPEIFPRLRNAIDVSRSKNGRFVILGSVAPSLMHGVSESLAGRIAIVELSPLSARELPPNSLDQLWLYGGFPDGGVLDSKRFPRWQSDYLDLMIQRDLPNWGLPAKPMVTERLVRMLASVHAQVWNASKIGTSLALNYQTVQSYLEYLQGAYLIRRLLPYSANLKKRLVKSPKIYIRDTGLLHVLLGCASWEDLLVQPWVGYSWEGFVIEQILITLNLSDERCIPYFIRTSSDDEIDLVFRLKGELWAVEVKLTSEANPEHARVLERLGEQIQADRKVVVHRGEQDILSSRCSFVSLPTLINMLSEIV